MAYQEVVFTSASEVGKLKGRTDTIVISICDPGSDKAPIQDGFKDVLYLAFDNVDGRSGKGVAISEAQANEILAFLDKHEAAADRILVNCVSGESRSAGVAFYMALKYNLEIEDDELGFMNHWVVHVLEKADARRQSQAVAL